MATLTVLTQFALSLAVVLAVFNIVHTEIAEEGIYHILRSMVMRKLAFRRASRIIFETYGIRVKFRERDESKPRVFVNYDLSKMWRNVQTPQLLLEDKQLLLEQHENVG